MLLIRFETANNEGEAEAVTVEAEEEEEEEAKDETEEGRESPEDSLESVLLFSPLKSQFNLSLRTR